jgi:hypothetical protein
MSETGEGKGNYQGEESGKQSGTNRMEQTFNVGVIFENDSEKSKCKLAIGAQESSLNNFPDGPQEETSEEQEGNNEYGK